LSPLLRPAKVAGLVARDEVARGVDDLRGLERKDDL